MRSDGFRFRCAGVPVRVRYSFLLVNLLLAASSRRRVTDILIWIGAAAFGVLVHELGHAWMARRFGGEPVIEMHTLGGLTSWVWTRGHRWTWQVACSLAGPALGLAFGALVGLARGPLLSTGAPDAVHVLMRDLYWVTLAWSVFNLFPILPLDGAAALEAVLGRWQGAHVARHRMRIVSVVAALLAAGLAFANGLSWAGALALLFAYNNAQALRGRQGLRISG